MPFNEILVGGPSFAELAGRTLALQELTAYPLIMLENGSMSRIFYRQFFLEHNAELKPDIEAGTTDQMLTLVRSDLGLAFGAGADGPRQPASQAHFADEFAGGYPVPLGLPGLRPPPPAKYRRAGVPPPAVGISEKQTKVNKKPAAPASLCTRYRRRLAFPCFLGVTGLGTQHALQAFQGCKACADGKYTGGVGQLF